MRFNRNKMMEQRRRAEVKGGQYMIALQGTRAFACGASPCNCPFELDTPSWRAWMAGWYEGFDRRFRGIVELRPLDKYEGIL